jgi:predicted PurR-regulated permease PerM
VKALVQQKEMEPRKIHTQEYSFVKKVWVTGGIFAFIAIALLLFKATFSVFLLVLAGTLIAVFFRGLSGLIQKKTKWKTGVCLTISIVGTLALIVLLFWLIGSKVALQVSELSNTLPQTVQKAREQLCKSSLGQKVVEKLSSPQSQQGFQSIMQTFFKSTFGVLGDIYVVLFIGIFFTASPQTYKRGIIKLVPSAGKQKAEGVLNDIGSNLRKWLKGKLFAMLVVFILTAIGLVIIGMPMWLTLALIAGILNFIPNFGPLIALIPAVLVALMQGPSTALWVAGLYILVQVAESNFITPMVQQHLIRIPPALIIIAQLLMAPLTGGWGLILATPLMVILMVFVKDLYLQRKNE